MRRSHSIYPPPISGFVSFRGGARRLGGRAPRQQARARRRRLLVVALDDPHAALRGARPARAAARAAADGDGGGIRARSRSRRRYRAEKTRRLRCTARNSPRESWRFTGSAWEQSATTSRNEPSCHRARMAAAGYCSNTSDRGTRGGGGCLGRRGGGGGGEGVALPAMHQLTACWVPAHERTRFITLCTRFVMTWCIRISRRLTTKSNRHHAICASGQFAGTVVAMAASPLVEWSWPSVSLTPPGGAVPRSSWRCYRARVCVLGAFGAAVPRRLFVFATSRCCSARRFLVRRREAARTISPHAPRHNPPRSVFYLFGAAGLVWNVVWQVGWSASLVAASSAGASADQRRRRRRSRVAPATRGRRACGRCRSRRAMFAAGRPRLDRRRAYRSSSAGATAKNRRRSSSSSSSSSSSRAAAP